MLAPEGLRLLALARYTLSRFGSVCEAVRSLREIDLRNASKAEVGKLSGLVIEVIVSC